MIQMCLILIIQNWMHQLRWTSMTNCRYLQKSRGSKRLSLIRTKVSNQMALFHSTNLQCKAISKMSCGREVQVLISGSEGGLTLLEQLVLPVSLSDSFPATVTRKVLNFPLYRKKISWLVEIGFWHIYDLN